MKKSKLLAALVAAPLFGLFTTAAQAGPGTMIFYPVKTTKQVSMLKPGNEIAMHCNACGATTMLKVSKDKHELQSFHCAACGRQFVAKTIQAAGNGPALTIFTEVEGRKTATLASTQKM